MVRVDETKLLLLLDTCGERASLALCRGDEVLAKRELAERTASAGLLGAVRELVAGAGERLGALGGVGVVNGPGSFTGLRVGLAVAKGLCEALGVPLAAVSRLAVLAEAGGVQQGLCVLRAGRDEVYVREVRGGEGVAEMLTTATAFAERAAGQDVVFAEEALRPVLEGLGVEARHVGLHAADALRLVRAVLAEGGCDLAGVDANYVRDEEAIYARPRGA